MFRDLIVEEVRAIREKLAAECNFDIRKIVEEAQRRQGSRNPGSFRLSTTLNWPIYHRIATWQGKDTIPFFL